MSAERPFHCNLCNKTYRTRKCLKKHKGAKHKGRKYPCTVCYKCFDSGVGRALHMKSDHEGNKYHCETCGKAFTQAGSAKRHKRTVHKDLATTSTSTSTSTTCTICDRDFSDLKRHKKRVHDKERSWICTYCDSKFFRSDELEDHIARTHRGRDSRSFPCEICGPAKVFISRRDLKKHMIKCHNEN